MQKHARELLFYIDDSGSRDPDKNPKSQSDVPDWFALGGLIVDVSEKKAIEDKVACLREKWPSIQNAPLRSYDIRNMKEGFRWMKELDEPSKNVFYSDITELLTGSPLLVTGCVVHRPGYNERYIPQYAERRWTLCRTAFHIAVERAAKYAKSIDARLRVYVERSDKPTESTLKGYFDEMRRDGLPFNKETSSKYRPMSPEELRGTLLEFRIKTKASPLMQLADLTLWPVCKGGYDQNNQNFKQLKESGRLLDSKCTPANGLLGIKYFCFPAQEMQKPAYAGS